MARFVIEGGRRLAGEVRVSGRKNSAVAVLPSALLARTPSTLENLPDIQDVQAYCTILRRLGVRATRLSSDTVHLDPTEASPVPLPYDLAKRLRASYYLLGASLGRFRQGEVPLPGGCDIGQRPIDQHIKGLRAMGADVGIEHGTVRARADRLKGAAVYLDVTSVGATINIMLAASLAEGTTAIENAAKESHVVDVANYLNSMGAGIIGAGTDVVKIRGVDRLLGSTHAIIPDEIEAATYMIAAVATGGDVTVRNVIPKHVESVAAKLRETGATVEENGDYIRVLANGRPRAVNIKTLPYPGFPTDAQQPMTVLLSLAEGTSYVTDNIWEGRFKHVDELKRMGTNIRVEGRTAVIEGVGRLMAAPVRATDLRAGAALVIAALAAQGETVIEDIEHVDRGYESMGFKLGGLGASIRRVD